MPTLVKVNLSDCLLPTCYPTYEHIYEHPIVIW